MIAKLENDIINVYNKKNILIGGIKSQSNFKNAEIKIREKVYQLSRNKWGKLKFRKMKKLFII